VEFNSTKPRVPFDLSDYESISQQRVSRAPLKKIITPPLLIKVCASLKLKCGKNEHVMRVTANGKQRVVSGSLTFCQTIRH